MDNVATVLSPSTSEKDNQNTSPFANENIVISKQEYIQFKSEIGYWESLCRRTKQQLEVTKQELVQEKAKVKDLQQRLFGKSSEKGITKGEGGVKKTSSNSRGQQNGSKGHGRTPRSTLPTTIEVIDVAEEDRCCPICHELRPEFPGTEDSEIIEVHVQAHVRIIKRNRVKSCQCEENCTIISAPPVPRVIPRSPYGVSFWTELIISKFLYAQPVNRTCQQFQHIGLPVSPGTVSGGFQQLYDLFTPVLGAMLDKQMTEQLFHADETTWRVFDQIQGKAGNRWYLWMMQSPSVIFFIAASGRAADIPIAFFEAMDDSIEEVFLVCDRYSAYKKLATDRTIIVLAFCWAHVRRDFIKGAKTPEFEEWMFSWVADIGELYRINNVRLRHWDQNQPLCSQSIEFNKEHEALKESLDKMIQQCNENLADKDLPKEKSAVLNSLKNHWSGLTVFAENPQVSMDNNQAERTVRNPVIGRKNYYGSGSIASALFAAAMFSILQTMTLWKLNPKHWLFLFLNACAKNGGKTPEDLSPFLPWSMDEARMALLRNPLPQARLHFNQEPELTDTS